jgi:hypothetical protein
MGINPDGALTPLAQVVQFNPREPASVSGGDPDMPAGVVLASQIEADSVYVAPVQERRWQRRETRQHAWAVQDGDVLVPFSWRAFVAGQVAVAMLPLAAPNRRGRYYALNTCHAPPGYLVLRPDPRWLDGAFLAHFLRHPDWAMLCAKWRALTCDKPIPMLALLRNIHMALPPLAEQRAWVGALQLDLRTLRARQQALHAADSERRLAFAQYFGATAVLRTRWRHAPLAELVQQILPGKPVPHAAGVGNGWRVLTPDHIGWNRLHPAQDQWCLAAPRRAVRVQAGDVLFSSARTGGGAALAPHDMAHTLIGPGVVILRNHDMEPAYLAGFLCSGTGLGEIERVAGHDRSGWLGRAAIGQIVLPVPPRACQAEFVQQRWGLDQACAAGLAHWQQAKDALSETRALAFRLPLGSAKW